MSDVDVIHQELHDRMRRLLQPGVKFTDLQQQDMVELTERLALLLPALARIDELMRKLERTDRVVDGLEKIQFSEPPV